MLNQTQLTPSLRLDEETHTYWLGPRAIPGISALLKYWGFIDDTYYTEEGREIGRAVHAGIHDLELGGAAASEFSNPKILHRLDEYLRFKSDKDFRVKKVEQIYGDPAGRYACKIDLLGTFGEAPQLCLVEVKCGAVMAWHQLQTAGQKRNIIDEGAIRRFALYLPAEGRYNLKEHKDRAEEFLIDGFASGYWWNANHNVKLTIGGTNGK
jgi:hypothetical protein